MDFGTLAQLPLLSQGKRGSASLTRALKGSAITKSISNLYVRFKVLGMPILRLAEGRDEAFKEQAGIASDLEKHMEELGSALSQPGQFSERVSRMEALNSKWNVASAVIEAMEDQDQAAYNKLCSVRDTLACDVAAQGIREFFQRLVEAAGAEPKLPDQQQRLDILKRYEDLHAIIPLRPQLKPFAFSCPFTHSVCASALAPASAPLPV